jgi:hypothetical protein
MTDQGERFLAITITRLAHWPRGHRAPPYWDNGKKIIKQSFRIRLYLMSNSNIVRQFQNTPVLTRRRVIARDRDNVAGRRVFCQRLSNPSSHLFTFSLVSNLIGLVRSNRHRDSQKLNLNTIKHQRLIQNVVNMSFWLDHRHHQPINVPTAGAQACACIPYRQCLLFKHDIIFY